MENEWNLPILETFTGSWTVDPWLSNRYKYYGRHTSALMQAAALGLLYEKFRPFNKGEQRRYHRLAKTNPDENVQVKVFRTAGRLPESFRRRLRREIVTEVRRLLASLDRIEGAVYDPHEVSAFDNARIILGYALMPLQVDGINNRVVCAIMKLDFERKKRIPPPP